MKYLLDNLGANLVSLPSVAAAFWLMANNHPASHWGWFIFLAGTTSAHVSYTSSDKKKE